MRGWFNSSSVGYQMSTKELLLVGLVEILFVFGIPMLIAWLIS